MTFEEWKNKTRERIDPDYLYFFDSFLKEFEDAYETGSAAESDVWTHTTIEGLEEKAFESWWDDYRYKESLGLLEHRVAKTAFHQGVNCLMIRMKYLEKDIEALQKTISKLRKGNGIIKLLSWDIRNRSYNPVKDLDEAEAFLKEAERYE